MGMLDTQRKICKSTFFNVDLLAETITYNGVEIPSLVEEGAELSRTDWNDTHTDTLNAKIGDLAVFSVLDNPDDKGVLEPTAGDVIRYGDREYNVSSVVEHDKAGGLWVLLAIRNERAFGR